MTPNESYELGLISKDERDAVLNGRQRFDFVAYVDSDEEPREFSVWLDDSDPSVPYTDLADVAYELACKRAHDELGPDAEVWSM